MNRLVIDRSDTVGILLDLDGNPVPKPQNWMELLNDDLNSIPFIKECIDDGFNRIEFKPIRNETGMIIAHKPCGFKWVIGFWKELNLYNG